ncbi:hypothetical protein [Dulcicalothrix desertica]|uniref:hypothetical protein n=1 Tax=Dulcicalothrix desertica TaxID=32056 RepID=UPI000F8F246F|nr:hypothetical protein [Dulcicalothrix desertica]
MLRFLNSTERQKGACTECECEFKRRLHAANKSKDNSLYYKYREVVKATKNEVERDLLKL